ncbi:MAG: ABC transporter substrate-binding protein [Candidatus Rokuibacteriota bacterium]|jgi:peptide/nickel transport system substrate-binding protein|nr:ABC transporter substrate-binding protein [Patescibacteria group bacterium]
MRHSRLAACVLIALLALVSPVAAAPEGEMTWGVHISLAPTWFDPAETQGLITPFMIMYAIHDAMAKSMPGNATAPSLAESWTVSPDGRTYDFTLRKGVKFHNGDALTSEDVKYSFDRYRGAGAKPLKERVAAVETPSPYQVRFRLKNPWPDFMTFYTAASGAGWIVPKKYVEKVGEDGYKKAPVGAGPYKFVSFTPGIELVMEAFDGYWRKTPSVKRLVFKVITDESTRLAALKRGEVDIVYSIRGELAEELVRTPGLTLKPTVIQSPQWVAMLDQWDPKSPWHDRRVRLAANLAIDRKAINQAITLGHSRLTYSIIPSTFDFYWQPPAYAFDPAQAKKLLAEAGYPSGFDAGDYYLDISYANVQEAIANYLQQVGIRTKLVSRERASHWSTYTDKKYKNLAYTASGAFGNAATRLEAYVVTGGAYVYGTYPDLDSLFKDQAAELDRKKREALLHRIQQLMHEKVMSIPLWELAFINGQGSRVQESGLGLIPGHAYSAPYEDVKLKPK